MRNIGLNGFGIDGAALKALRTLHGVSAEAMARLLGVAGDTLAAWEAGEPIPAAALASVRTAAFAIRFNSRSAWMQRVSLASGMEILLDPTLRMAALSRVARNTPYAEKLGLDLPANLMLGKHLHAFLPNLDCTMIQTHGAGLNDLYEIGFFTGEITLVRITAEINFGLYDYCGHFEYWPVATCDAGTLVHQISFVDTSRRTVLRKPGILVQSTEIVRRSSEAPAAGTGTV